MDISVRNQILTVFFSFLIGIPCGFIYDVFYFFRMLNFPNYSEKFILKNKDKKFKRIDNPLNKKIGKNRRIASFIVIGIIDVIYFLLLAPVFCIFIYIRNDGIIRWYIFVFSIVGAITYKLTAGKVISCIIAYMSFYTRVLIENFFLIVKTPIKNLLKNYKRKKNREQHEENNKKILLKIGK